MRAELVEPRFPNGPLLGNPMFEINERRGIEGIDAALRASTCPKAWNEPSCR